MLQTTSLKSQPMQLASIRAKARFLTWQELVLAIAGGITLAGLGQILGRMGHLAWPVPMSGSIFMALPRTVILLTILLRVDRFGVLTIVGISEVATKFAMVGGGMWPMALIVPLLANIAGDMIWTGMRQLRSQTMSLILTGGALCGARMLIALSCWSILQLSFSETFNSRLGLVLMVIVVINIVLGMIAGVLVKLMKYEGRGSSK